MSRKLIGHEWVEVEDPLDDFTPSGQLFDDPQEKRSFIQKLFTDIAPRYDWFNRIASCGFDQGWRKTLIEQAALSPGMQVLDVCTGTGDLAILCAKRLRALEKAVDEVSGRVVGTDMNAGMLKHALRKQRSAKLSIQWLQADTLLLPFPSHLFDRVTIGFSTRNLASLEAGLFEMVRMLKPGGQLLILETGRPHHPLLRIGYWLFLMTVARLIGWVLTGRCWPFTYLAQSVRRFVTPEQMMERLKLCDVTTRYVPLTGGLASLYIAIK